jgi:hypothetical protein
MFGKSDTPTHSTKKATYEVGIPQAKYYLHTPLKSYATDNNQKF